MPRRMLALGLWGAATLVGTGVSFAIVSAVTAGVVTADVSKPASDQVALFDSNQVTTTIPPITVPSTSAPSPTIAAAPKPAPTTTAPPRVAASRASVPVTFTARGGIVTVECDRSAIRLLSARPDDGYRLRVGSGGPDHVDVAFVSDQDGTRVEVVCRDGNAVPRFSPLDVRDGDRRDGGGDRYPYDPYGRYDPNHR
jgi:hypothetical protein